MVPLFGRVDGTTGGCTTLHYYFHYNLPSSFRKPVTPLASVNLTTTSGV